MSRKIRGFSTILAVLVLAGCVSMGVSTITNLTPSRLPRKDTNQYMFSVEYLTRQRTLVPETMQVSVVVGERVFPMQRTPLSTNRWETLVPVPAGEDLINYRYRFEYDYKAIPTLDHVVKESNLYQLRVGDAGGLGAW